MMYTVKMYQTATGKVPISEWLKKLKDPLAHAAFDMRIARLSMGHVGNAKFLGSGVYELKIDTGPGYRVYFGKIGLTVMLLLCAGDKKTQKKDIEQAKKYLFNFLQAWESHD